MSEMCKWNPRGAACNERIAAAQRCTELASDLATAQREMTEERERAEARDNATTQQVLYGNIADILDSCGVDFGEAADVPEAISQLIGMARQTSNARFIESRLHEQRTELLKAKEQAETQRDSSQSHAAQMREALESVDGVIRESRGVDGWYLNGDIATWGELGLDSEVANALSATPTQAEQRYAAAVAVVEAAPKRDELRHLYWETCKTCEHSCVNEGQWKQCELKQRLDVAEKVYDDALAAYASAKGEKK